MRQSGYYWVKYDGKWIIAKYLDSWNAWWVAGQTSLYENGEFSEIDERQIVRN